MLRCGAPIGRKGESNRTALHVFSWSTTKSRAVIQRKARMPRSPRKLGSILGPDSAEHPLKPWYRTQNRAKRFNRLDNRNCFGTRGSEVQILSPRPILKKTTVYERFLKFLPIGLLANAALGRWWADPVSALVMVPIIVRESWQSLEGEAG